MDTSNLKHISFMGTESPIEEKMTVILQRFGLKPVRIQNNIDFCLNFAYD